MSSPVTAPSRPALLIIAGPNGSGKSSTYTDAEVEFSGRTLWINNPDLLTARLQHFENLQLLEANREAVNRIEAWLYASIELHQTVGVETVLSTGKYRKLVEKAKSRGFEFWFFYVLLDSPERNVERVKIRTSRGGHAVPREKIIERYSRSLAQFPWFFAEAQRAWVYDNSGATPRLIADKDDKETRIYEDALPVIKAAVESIQFK
jgi:predicted ABC-type ATPase